MDVATALQKLPRGRLGSLPVAEFGRVWAAVEQRGRECSPDDYYVAGLIAACRWVAQKEHYAPVTRVLGSALPEALDAEYLAALRVARSRRLHPRRVDKALGVVAVLGWVSQGTGEPSLTKPLADAG
jgi:hypothetical protein